MNGNPRHSLSATIPQESGAEERHANGGLLAAHEVSSFAATTHIKPAANAGIYKPALRHAQVNCP
jgi:hypothetical protein